MKVNSAMRRRASSAVDDGRRYQERRDGQSMTGIILTYIVFLPVQRIKTVLMQKNVCSESYVTT